jgi:hypothetical protein
VNDQKNSQIIGPISSARRMCRRMAAAGGRRVPFARKTLPLIMLPATLRHSTEL